MSSSIGRAMPPKTVLRSNPCPLRGVVAALMPSGPGRRPDRPRHPGHGGEIRLLGCAEARDIEAAELQRALTDRHARPMRGIGVEVGMSLHETHRFGLRAARK